MRNTLTILFIFCATLAIGQGSYTPMNQQYDFKKNVMFGDQVRMNFIQGFGNFLAIDENGWLVRSTGTDSSTVSIQISQVQGLQTNLNLKQNLLIPIGGILISNDTISLGNLTVADIGGLIDSLAAKQNKVKFGYGLQMIGDSVYVSMIAQSNVIGLQDSLDTKQRTLIAGAGIAISGDTIRSTASGSEWTRSGSKVFNNTDSIGIGTIPLYPFDIDVKTQITSNSFDTTLRVTNNGTGTALYLQAPSGVIFNANGIEVTAIDTVFDHTITNQKTLITHYALRNTVTGGTNISSGGQSIFVAKSGQNLQFRNIRAKAESGITVDVASNTIEIGFNSALTGDTAVNIGNGAGIFKEKLSDSLLFKTIVGSGVSSTDSTIVITSGTPEAANLGTGNNIYVSGSPDTLKFKTLVAGSGITLTPSATEIAVGLSGSGFVTISGNETITGAKSFSAPITASDGVVGGTSLALRSTGANAITFSTNGVQRGSFSSTGLFNVNSFSINSAITFPTTDGTNGQVLKTNGSGTISWQPDNNTTYTAGNGLGLTGTTFNVPRNAIVDTMLRTSSGTSVIGRSANSTGEVADISASANNQILRREGGTLGFGSINLAASNAVGTSVLGISNGGTNAANAADARTNLGASTIGANIFTSTNPSAIRFLRANADNTVTWRTAAEFRGDIGAGTGNGTVTSITAGTGLSGGAITSAGTIALNAVLNDLTNVSATSPTTGQALVWNGSIWTSQAVSAVPDVRTYFNDTAKTGLSTEESFNWRVAASPNRGNELSDFVNLDTNSCYLIEGKVTIKVSVTETGKRSESDFARAIVGFSDNGYNAGTAVDSMDFYLSETSLTKETIYAPFYVDGSTVKKQDGVIYITLICNPVKICTGTTELKPHLLVGTTDTMEFALERKSATLRATKVNAYTPSREMLNE